MEGFDERQFRRQINVRIDPQTERELRAIIAQTQEEYSLLIRRLIHEEAVRLELAQPPTDSPAPPA